MRYLLKNIIIHTGKQEIYYHTLKIFMMNGFIVGNKILFMTFQT